MDKQVVNLEKGSVVVDVPSSGDMHPHVLKMVKIAQVQVGLMQLGFKCHAERVSLPYYYSTNFDVGIYRHPKFRSNKYVLFSDNGGLVNLIDSKFIKQFEYSDTNFHNGLLDYVRYLLDNVDALRGAVK